MDNVTGDKAIEALSQTRVGPFELQGIIGRGGMGIVYDAKRIDGVFEQHVAIKFVYPSITALTGRETVFFEARCLGQLAHPNIVTIHDAGELALGACYFVMEYLEGEALDAYSRRTETTTQDIIKRVIELCDALEATHRIHIVHSDIKPNNVVVNTEGRTKVLDFGIAHIMEGEVSPTTHSSLTSAATDDRSSNKNVSEFRNSNDSASNNSSESNTSSNIKGMTLAFAAPEQQQGTVSPLSDIYSIGALLRYVLSLNAHYKNLPKARQQELQRIADQCMQQNPDDRYQQVESIKRDLQNWLEGKRLSFEPKVSLLASRKWVKRNPWLSAFTLLILLSFPVALHYQQQLQNEQAQSQEVAKHFESFIRYTDPAISGKPMSEAKQMLLDTYNNVANSTQLTLANKHRIVVTIFDSLLGLGAYKQVLAFEQDTFFRALLSIDPNSDFALTRQLVTAQIKQGSNAKAYERYQLAHAQNLEVSMRASLLLELAVSPIYENVLGKEGLTKWEVLNNRIAKNVHLFSDEELLANTISKTNRLYKTLFRQIEVTENRKALSDEHLQSLYIQTKAAIDQLPVTHPDTMIVLKRLSHISFLMGSDVKYSRLLRENLEVLEQVYGKYHPITIKALWGIGNVLHSYERSLAEANVYYQLAYERSIKTGFLYNGLFVDYLHLSLSYMGERQALNESMFTPDETLLQKLDWKDQYQLKFNRIWYTLEFFPEQSYREVIDSQKWLETVPESVAVAEFNVPSEKLFLAVLKASLEGKYVESINLYNNGREVIDGSSPWPVDALEEYLYRKQGDFNESLKILEEFVPKHDDLGLFVPDGLFQDAFLWRAQGLAELGQLEEAASLLQACFDFSYNLRPEPDNFWLQVVATMADYYSLPLDTYDLTVPLMDNNFLLTGGKQRLMPPESKVN